MDISGGMKIIYTLEDAHKNTRETSAGHFTGNGYQKRITAKPENAKSLKWRIRAALEVLKGRAVPLEWL